MKKVLALALSLALIATLAISGTIAYLKDEEEQVNVMTLGNVNIEQLEYERVVKADGSYKTDTIDNQTSYVLQSFTQNKPLLPIVGDPNEPSNSPAYAGYDETTTVRMTQVDSYGGMQVFAGKNAQDKFVTVENTGKSDAYVRTFVAIEVGSANPELVQQSYHNTWTKAEMGVVEINGVNYKVREYSYNGAAGLRHENGILPAGETTYPNLSQVYLKHNATNENLEDIDGNGNGTLDILVLSQAVQAAGFANAETALDTAFGAPDALNADGVKNVVAWFSKMEFPTSVSTAAELKAALEAGKDVILTDDIDLGDAQITIPAGQDATLNLAGKDLTGAYTGTDYYAMFNIKDGASLTVSGEGNVTAKTEATENNRSLAIFLNAGDLTINGGSYKVTDATEGKTWIIATIVDNRTSNASCTADLTINGGTFKANSTADTTYIWNQEAGSNLGELYFNGGTYDAAIVYEDYNGHDDVHIAAGVVINAYSGNT